MILFEWFDGDDMALAGIQHDNYLGTVGGIAQCLQQRVGELAPELRPFLPIERFDHRDLQWLHDLLAARYRFEWLREHKDDPEQTDLFGGASRPDSASFAYHWHDTLGRQVEALVESYPNTVRYVIISMLWPNPDKRGIGAEEAFFAEVVQPEQERLRTVSI